MRSILCLLTGIMLFSGLLSGCGVSQKNLRETSALLQEGIRRIDNGECQTVKHFFIQAKSVIDEKIK